MPSSRTVSPSAGPGGTTDKLIIGNAWVSNTDEITFGVFNSDTGAQDATNRNYRVTVIKWV